MKKRLLIVIAIIAAGLFIAWGAVNLLLCRTLSEKKVNAFLTDSQDAFLALLTDDASDDSETGMDADLMVGIAAASYTAREGDKLTEVNGGILIPAEDMEREVSALFYEGSTAGFEGSGAVTTTENGDYLYTPAEGELTYEITESFYGYVGSEPTTLTVCYTCGDRECEADYTLVAEDDSTYTFNITDLTVRK